MLNENAVKWIVATYNLPPRLESRVTRIAIERMYWRLEHVYPETFDSLYRDIADLIEKWTNYGARIPVRLDAPIPWGSYHDSIGTEDKSFSELEEERPQSLLEIVGILKERLDSPYFNFVHQLL